MTREEREREARRNQILISSILVVIMVLSTLGYAFYNSSTEKIKYNGIKFYYQEGFWNFKINEIEFSTSYNPKETENISIEVTKTLNDYNGKPLYFSYDSDYDSIQEIARNIGRFVLRIQEVCLDNENCEEDIPIKNCSDNIIIIREGEENVVREEDKCVYIIYKENPILTSDAFIFKILGIK